MNYTFSGRLSAQLCADRREDLSRIEVRLYRSPASPETDAAAAARPKETLRFLSEKDMAAREKLLLASTQTGEAGNYHLKMDSEQMQYDGGPVEMVLLIRQVPGQSPKAKGREPLWLSLTVLRPEWRQSPEGIFFVWDYSIPSRFWCSLRALFDAWLICGRVVLCSNPQQGLGGVTVKAFDADWLKDDFLGQAITDPGGYFRIDYASIDFKQTFLSPIFNVETPFPPYNSGPDLYFQVEGGGEVLLAETRADGKKAGRENSGPCFCVQLCAEVPVESTTENIPGAWTGIGTAFTLPDEVNLNDFSTDGFMGAGRFAAFQSIRFTGSAPRRQNGNPVEYRFLISEMTASNAPGTAPVPLANFSRIVNAASGLFVNTKVGEMIRFSPFRIVNIHAIAADLDSEGWLDVNTSIQRTFADNPALDVSELSVPGLWHWVDSDGLMALNTAVMAPEASALVARVAIRFEIREVINKAANQFAAMPGSGYTLNSLAMNNLPATASIAVAEHSGGAACSPLSGSVHLNYVASHPLLRNVSLNVRSNDGSYNHNLSDGNIPLSNNINDAITALSNPALALPGAPHSCTYIATLGLTRRLHSGDGADDGYTPQTSFYLA